MEDERLYIAPYHADGRVGWLVRVSWYPIDRPGTQRRKWHSKLFEFKDYAIENDALIAARAYRDVWLAEHGATHLLRRRVAFLSSELPRNNKTGILGVSRADHVDNEGYRVLGWQTTFPHPTNPDSPIGRKFSIRDHGESGALRRAVESRRQGMLAALEARNIGKDENAYEMIAFYDDIIANLNDFRDQSTDATILDIVLDPALGPTTKFKQIQARIAQQRFRREVLEFFDYRCAITGSQLLIRAGHIKPWRVATNAERVDPANGLALSPVYDAAFDVGLISFRADGVILLQTEFAESALQLGIFGQEKISAFTDEHLAYLHWHRCHIFGKYQGMADKMLNPSCRSRGFEIDADSRQPG